MTYILNGGWQRTAGVHQLQRGDFTHREQLEHFVLCLRGRLWQFLQIITCCFTGFPAGWESGDLQEEFGIAYYLTTNQSAPLSSSQTLTVKDLLLSDLGQKVRRKEFGNKLTVWSDVYLLMICPSPRARDPALHQANISLDKLLRESL